MNRRKRVVQDVDRRVGGRPVSAAPRLGAPDREIVIVGAGFSGIGTAYRLDQVGLHDYLVIEEGPEVGGTWHWNTYPGVAVDIPSFSYQYSFKKRSDWSRVFAPGRELKAYAEQCADDFGIRDRLRLNTTVTSLKFDEDERIWHVTTGDREVLTARYVVCSRPRRWCK